MQGGNFMSKITYTKIGDYYIPNLTIKPSPPIGKYGRMRRDYLRDHRPAFYNRLILHEQLQEHCAEINEAIENRLECPYTTDCQIRRSNRKTKRNRPNEMGRFDEHLQSSSRRNRFCRVPLCVNLRLCNA